MMKMHELERLRSSKDPIQNDSDKTNDVMIVDADESSV